MDNKIKNRLLEKSIEAFIMAIEIYNKPTLKYRVEGFAFFICNAWELMLKAKIVKDFGEDNIYFPDGNNRTISLDRCIKKIFTNENDPLRKNLETIIELRNTCTHFITLEYEQLYAPIFQACVFNFVTKIYEFFQVDIAEKIPEHFIHLSISTDSLEYDAFTAKYGDNIANKFESVKNSVEKSIKENQSDAFAIAIHHEYYLTKKQNPNSTVFRIVKDGEDAEESIRIVKDVKDPNVTHPLTLKNLLEAVKNQLVKINPSIHCTRATLQEFIKFNKLKENKKYCFTSKINKNPSYQYSYATVDLIVSAYKKDNEIGNKIHEALKNSRKK